MRDRANGVQGVLPQEVAPGLGVSTLCKARAALGAPREWPRFLATMVVFALSSSHASWDGKAEIFSHSWCQVLGTGEKDVWSMTSPEQGCVTLKELLLQHFPAHTPGTNPQGGSSVEAPSGQAFQRGAG